MSFPRFLVDEDLSVKLPSVAHARGYEAIHVNHRGLHQATDWEILNVIRKRRVDPNYEQCDRIQGPLREVSGTSWSRLSDPICAAPRTDRAFPNSHNLAEEMGNSVAMVRTYYDAVVAPSVAKLWWRIRPAKPKNLIPLKAAA